MANRKKPNRNKAILKASQVGDLEAMQIAATRGLTLREVGVKRTIRNRIDFIKLQRDVNRMS